MGKKRIIKKTDSTAGAGVSSAVKRVSSKTKISSAQVNILSTYNNTLIAVVDLKGDVQMSSSAGSLGFSGTKKGTPYAATKVAEFLGEKAKAAGIKTLSLKVKGIGAGRDAALRSFVAQGFDIMSIRDATPIPHGGVKPKKPRRV